MPTAALDVADDAIGREELVYAVGIIGECSATKEAELVIGIADDRDQLTLHADVFHFADERFDPRFLRAADLAEARANRTLRQTSAVVGACHGPGEGKRWRTVKVIALVDLLLEPMSGT